MWRRHKHLFLQTQTQRVKISTRQCVVMVRVIVLNTVCVTMVIQQGQFLGLGTLHMKTDFGKPQQQKLKILEWDKHETQQTCIYEQRMMCFTKASGKHTSLFSFLDTSCLHLLSHTHETLTRSQPSSSLSGFIELSSFLPLVPALFNR